MSCSNMPDVCFTFWKRDFDSMYMSRLTKFFIKSRIKSTRSWTSAVNSASSIGRSCTQRTKGVGDAFNAFYLCNKPGVRLYGNILNA